MSNNYSLKHLLNMSTQNQIQVSIKSNVKTENNFFVVLSRHKNSDSKIIGKFSDYRLAKFCANKLISMIEMFGNNNNTTEIFIDGSTKKIK